MADTNLKKNKQGYGYMYTDLAQIHEFLEENNMSYYQYIERIDNEDYVMTVKIVNGEEKPALRGCRVINATLSGKSNPAQEQGSALTYARRYSLLMAFGLATEDDDAGSLTKGKEKQTSVEQKINQVYINTLKTSISKNGIEENTVQEILKKYNYTKIEDITSKNYKNIIEEFKKIVGGKNNE